MLVISCDKLCHSALKFMVPMLAISFSNSPAHCLQCVCVFVCRWIPSCQGRFLKKDNTAGLLKSSERRWITFFAWRLTVFVANQRLQTFRKPLSVLAQFDHVKQVSQWGVFRSTSIYGKAVCRMADFMIEYKLVVDHKVQEFHCEVNCLATR